MPQSTQSCTINTVMDAVQTVLLYNTGLDIAYVKESYAEPALRYEAEPYSVIFRMTDESPFLYNGSGRQAAPSDMVLEIILRVRYAVDQAGRDDIWARDTGRGLWTMREYIRGGFNNRNLFATYDGNGNGTSQPLTIRPMQQLECPEPKKRTDDKTEGECRLYFQIPLVQPLTA